MSGSPYEAPSAKDATPAALRWYRLYIGATAAVMLAWALVFPLTLVAPLQAHPPTGLRLLALEVFLLALPLVRVLALLAPRSPWAWTLGLVVLAFDVPSCFLPLALPLLLAWRKPEVRAAYRLPP